MIKCLNCYTEFAIKKENPIFVLSPAITYLSKFYQLLYYISSLTSDYEKWNKIKSFRITKEFTYLSYIFTITYIDIIITNTLKILTTSSQGK